MSVDIWAVVAATVAMFAVGAAWYMGLFSKAWGEIHGFDKLSKAEQKALQDKVGPLYGFQVVVTVCSAYVLAKMMTLLPSYSPYALAAMLWFGFVMPATVSGVLFGGTEPKWLVKKTLIQASESLAHLLVAAWVISLIQK